MHYYYYCNEELLKNTYLDDVILPKLNKIKMLKHDNLCLFF